ncbi:chloride channel protein [Demequina sp. NBRC 110054]|uniref:chloride channel protein n=1 Tax=Demequina sp. NBRC 110054 TaxID=1570343 RepID=UPI00190EB684|nr:chloride channel protein [Demequina sp. NBRC 110054]
MPPAPASLPQRALAWLRRSENSALIALALVVGAAAGFGAIAFRWLIETFTMIFSGHADYSAITDHAPNPWVPWLGGFFVILAPAVGGLIYGPIIHRWAREARGHGVPEVMYAISKRGGRIPVKVALVKALASAITIGSGGSVGREGPIVQIGSALGSSLARAVKLNESQVRLLVACGAAGGIAATFNAPIAGVFFAMELLLVSFAARTFAAVVLSSVTASVIARAVLGDEAFLVLPEFHVSHVGEYGLYVVLGVLAALVAMGFTKALYWFEDMADRIWKGPEWLRPSVGGLLLGVLLFFIPQMYGVGYPVLENAVTGEYVVGFLLVLLLAKVVATSLTIAIGGSGGVFAPSLFLGAMLGAAFGQAAAWLMPDAGITPGAYALVGMAAVFGGASRAPITAVIILFELTGEYTIILPLLLAVVVSTMITSHVAKDSIYTAKLRRRGVDLTRRPGATTLAGISVKTLMRTAPRTVTPRLTAAEAMDKMLAIPRKSLPVVTEHGEYVGVVTLTAAASAMSSDDDAEEVTVSQLIEWRDFVGPDTPVEDVLDDLLEGDTNDGLPVLDDDGALVGWLRQEAVLKRMAAKA